MPLKKLIVIFAAVLILLCGCQKAETNLGEVLSAPGVTGEFNFSILKVGQADAIIMKTQNHCVIIDCGEEDDGGEVVEYLADNKIEKVDYLFVTHFDKDHVGGVAEVIQSVSVEHIITPDYEGSNDEYESFNSAVFTKGINTARIAENTSFILDDVLFEIYPPLKKSYSEGDNDFSLAVAVTHGENRFLFTGDAEKARLSEIMSQTEKEYDFLKFPHHGRYNGVTKKFLERVKPSYSVITCSEKNPAEEQSVAALEAVGCKVYFTKDGNVCVSSDGAKLQIKQ